MSMFCILLHLAVALKYPNIQFEQNQPNKSDYISQTVDQIGEQNGIKADGDGWSKLENFLFFCLASGILAFLSTSSVEEEKDLGVYVSDSCTPSKHVAAAAQKANQVLGQLLRAFTYRDKFHFIKLYKQYVRHHLEYCVQAWSPWLQQDIDLIEKVQQRAVKAVSGLSGSYSEKLAELKLLSLADRRSRGDMIQTFKIVNKIDDVEPSDFFTFSTAQHSHATRQAATVTESATLPSLGLSQGPCNLELRRNFFSQRVVAPWNTLPTEVQSAPSVDQFKIRYDSVRAELANT